MESREDQAQPREGKKVAICGFAESYKSAPFNDASVDIWGLNELHKYLPRWHRWFELHDAETLGVTARDLSEGEQRRHLAWLKQDHGKPIYMQPAFCDGRFPNAVPYPLDRMIARFGRYFASSIAYMLALAIDEGYDWIGLYGVDLASDVEYPGQRPNAEYLVGMARGLGRTVVVAERSALLKTGHLYGYEVPVSTSAAPVLAAIDKHHAALREKHEKTLAELNTMDGALQAYENVRTIVKYADRGVAM